MGLGLGLAGARARPEARVVSRTGTGAIPGAMDRLYPLSTYIPQLPFGLLQHQ